MNAAISKVLVPFFKPIVHDSCAERKVFGKKDGEIAVLVTEEYLALLLSDFAVRDRLEDLEGLLQALCFKALGPQASESDEAAAWKSIGEAALLAAGFIAPHARRSFNSQIYAEMGMQAYGRLDCVTPPDAYFKSVYGRFAKNILPFISVLQGIGYETVYRCETFEILRRYAAKRSESDFNWLVSRGFSSELLRNLP